MKTFRAYIDDKRQVANSQFDGKSNQRRFKDELYLSEYDREKLNFLNNTKKVVSSGMSVAHAPSNT